MCIQINQTNEKENSEAMRSEMQGKEKGFEATEQKKECMPARTRALSMQEKIKMSPGSETGDSSLKWTEKDL